MKVLAIIIFCSCLIVGAGVWVFYPTSVQSEMKTFRILSQSEFSSLRKDALEFAHQFEVKGVEINAGDSNSSSFEIYCKGVPVLLVINGPILLTSHVRMGADSRAPDVARFRMDVYQRLEPEGKPGVAGPVPVQIGKLEKFLLKHRDGIDVEKQCR